MPNRNQRGPEGQGPMTGRGLGRCKGQGLGRGQGRGQGQSRRFDGAPSQDDQANLVAEVRALRAELAALKNTINNPGEDQ
jgi:hypothetical protein